MLRHASSDVTSRKLHAKLFGLLYSPDGSAGTATYTSSWIAPKADCHTQQYFHYMGQKGEIRADQAGRSEGVEPGCRAQGAGRRAQGSGCRV